MSNPSEDREIVVDRVVDAPRELVFDAFTQKAHIEKWWAPREATTLEMEVKPGGVWRYSQPIRGGAQQAFRVEFIEITRPSRLVYDYGTDTDNAPDPVRTTVLFEDEGGKTRINLQLLFATKADREQAVKYGAIVGAMQALEGLADYVATL